MKDYTKTQLWNRTLAVQPSNDEYKDERDYYRTAYIRFRSKVEVLSHEIALSMPQFTVHDITHIDALWEMADIILPPELEINPVEAFILGGAFLIHDLGMGGVAYNNGLDKIKNSEIWKDTQAILCKKYGLDTERIENETFESVIRYLHAQQAEKLPLISWQGKDSSELFLIDDPIDRQNYGEIIGKIAYSHWWNTEELLEKLPSRVGATGTCPQEWTIDPIKLACIIRLADAMHIDDRRAPFVLKIFRNPTNDSAIHWEFQQKLSQPFVKNDQLVYTSKSAFRRDECKAWWLCQDTLKMINDELEKVDKILTETDRTRMVVKHIAGIESSQSLAQYIKVEGWTPIDSQIRVSNVAKLVERLGGRELYGDNMIIPLRELIQNATDAIRARRILDDEPEDYGLICVQAGEDETGTYIQVEDNGTGMSKTVLKEFLIDFGNSFWNSDNVKYEFPGLISKGFSSTGKYGIGFFSVFMWGEKVSVISNRYDADRNKTLVLEFDDGTYSRPFIRKANVHEYIKNGGTRIRVWLSDKSILTKIKNPHNQPEEKISMAEIIEHLCPAIDCNLNVEEFGKKENVIRANDWMTIDPMKLIHRVIGAQQYNKIRRKDKHALNLIANHMRLIEDAGNVVGRAALYKEDDMHFHDSTHGIVTVGGIATSYLNGIIGILLGDNIGAARNAALPIVSCDCISNWSTEQASLLKKCDLPDNTQTECASIIRRLYGNTLNLHIAFHKKRGISYNELKHQIQQSGCSKFLIVQDASIHLIERSSYDQITFDDNVIWVGMGVPAVLQSNHNLDWMWPNKGHNFMNLSLETLVIKAFSEVWNVDIDKVKNLDEKKYTRAPIGKNQNGNIVYGNVYLLTKH